MGFKRMDEAEQWTWYMFLSVVITISIGVVVYAYVNICKDITEVKSRVIELEKCIKDK